MSLDPCTLSNYTDFNVVHTSLDIEVSFDTKRIFGKVSYKLQRTNKLTTQLILDSSYLDIQAVAVDGVSAQFVVRPRTEPYGSPLEITFNPVDIGSVSDISDTILVEITYSTTEKCTALQFIRGDTGPYLFSQCQSIHARSMVPCFDTPAVKAPFSARVRSRFAVLMSGRPVSADVSAPADTDAAGSNAGSAADAGSNADSNADSHAPAAAGEGADHAGTSVSANADTDVYYFSQPIPIPSYLLAIASGPFIPAPIGPRSSVYSEPPTIDACQWEFSRDMEDFLQVAESLVFPYEWGQFDILVLPMSFPYGGMENPNITFATPSLICKDRSQVKVVAHELAHSWAGNLVTNCSWEHFWLNEGWTVYLERRILGAVAERSARRAGASTEAAAAAGEQYRHFAAILGWNGLAKSMAATPGPATSLVWDLNGGDPDEFYSRVPYDKGFVFLFYLEQKLGRTEWDKFIPYYFQRFKYTSIDSYQFIESLYDFFGGSKDVLDGVDFEAWLHGTGLPEKPDFDTSLVDECTQLSDKWVQHLSSTNSGTSGTISSTFGNADIVSFDANQHLVFLENLSTKLDDISFDPQSIRSFPSIYPYYKNSGNFEIIFEFNSLLIKHGKYTREDQVVKLFADWLGTVGRMKYVRPGYRLLKDYVSGEFAEETFGRFESLYHPICRNMVRKDLQ